MPRRQGRETAVPGETTGKSLLYLLPGTNQKRKMGTARRKRMRMTTVKIKETMTMRRKKSQGERKGRNLRHWRRRSVTAAFVTINANQTDVNFSLMRYFHPG